MRYKVYKKYIDYLNTVKEAKSNPQCTKSASGGRCTSATYHLGNWNDSWGGEEMTKINVTQILPIAMILLDVGRTVS